MIRFSMCYTTTMHQMKIRPKDYLLIAFFAAFAALAVFARFSEKINVMSADGRAVLAGQAPQSFGQFSIIKEETLSKAPHTAVVGAVYRVNPESRLLPIPLTLGISYADIDLRGRAPDDLVLGRWHDAATRWESVPSMIDKVQKRIYTETRSLSLWTLMAPASPYLPPSLDVLIASLIQNRPSDALGYTVAVDYATVPNDFVLLRPTYREDLCRPFIRGDRQKIVEDVIFENGVTYRVVVTWELGDPARCH